MFAAGFDKVAFDYEGHQENREKKDLEFLKGVIKKQKLQKFVPNLAHPKVNPSSHRSILAEVIRRHGKPELVLKANSGGGEGDHAYSHNYPDKFWKSIGGKL